MQRALLVSALISLIACTSSKDSSEGDDSGSGGSGAFAPQEGIWDMAEGESDGGCNLDDFIEDTGESATEAGGAVDLVMDADGGGFSLIDPEDDSSEPVHCTLWGWNFVCDAPSSDDDDDEPMDFRDAGLDAVINMDFSFGGSFSSTTAGVVTMTVDMACSGEDCDDALEMLEGFGVSMTVPCTEVQSYPVNAR